MEIDINPSDKLDPEVQSWLEKLGPGLITGAADNDPSGIATYSQAGAQFGFNMLWTIITTYSLMVAIQIFIARHHRAVGASRSCNRLYKDRSDKGPLLELRDQWSGSVPIMALIMSMAANPQMGSFIIPVRLRITGWAATIAMGAATLAMSGFTLAPRVREQFRRASQHRI